MGQVVIGEEENIDIVTVPKYRICVNGIGQCGPLAYNMRNTFSLNRSVVALKRAEEQWSQRLDALGVLRQRLLQIAYKPAVDSPGPTPGFTRVQTGAQQPRLIEPWQDD
jgi:hypothetical protein